MNTPRPAPAPDDSNARRCGYCRQPITPPSLSMREYDQEKIAAALAGFCSPSCQGKNADDVVGRGLAWWQKAVRHG